MAISSADLTAIAKAVWTIDGIIPNPDDNPANPFWEPQHAIADLGVQVRFIEAAMAGVSAKVGADPQTVAAAVLAGLSPAQIAGAIATSLGPEIGQQVVTELQQALATPAAASSPAAPAAPAAPAGPGS
jgi:hypothetical protein